MTGRKAFTARDSRGDRLRRPATPGRAAALVVVGLLLGGLLTAPALLDTAQRQPYGPTRSVLVGAAERLAAVSAASRLDVPWRTLDGLVHSAAPPLDDPPPPTVAAPAPTAPATSSPRATPAEGAPVQDTPATPAPTAPVEPPSPAPSSAPAAPASEDPDRADGRVPTAADPLRVWVAGDSMWERPGPELVGELEATGVVDVVELEYRYSTGLTRPDFFDWPAHAARQLATLQPEIVLFVVGPNDSQPLVEGGVRHEPRTDGFAAAYTARVRTMMEVLAAGSDHVLWVGLPIMRDSGFDQRMRDLDTAYASQAALVDGVTHVSTRALFAGADGSFAEYLPGPDGPLQAMRNRDGIHLSEAGAERLADHLFALLDARHGLS